MYLAMGIFVVVAVVLDQVSKALTVANIPLSGSVEAIKGVFHFTYVQNHGAAFSMLQGQKWLFVVIFAVLVGLFLWLLIKSLCPLPSWNTGAWPPLWQEAWETSLTGSGWAMWWI